ncbi:MAG: DUF2335 domain-containing protein, partial [Bacteroidales bacterium]|nr:DUF2335 domain-containing protein [Bacteroidales bacterium]
MCATERMLPEISIVLSINIALSMKKGIKQKSVQVDTPVEQKRSLETIAYEESVLPPAHELEAYQRVDPDLVKFLVASAKDEQDFRHSFAEKQLDVIKNDNRRVISINRLGLVFAFILVLISIAATVFLLYLDKPVVGSIFGGESIVALINHTYKHIRDHETRGYLESTIML